jgi:uncharacterized protein YjiS (DUF1127 family)
MKSSILNRAIAREVDTGQSSPFSWFSAVFASLRKSSSDRALRRHLAELDDTLLRDIGIGEDEIWRVRAQQSFKPRNWH